MQEEKLHILKAIQGRRRGTNVSGVKYIYLERTIKDERGTKEGDERGTKDREEGARIEMEEGERATKISRLVALKAAGRYHAK